MPRNAAGDWTPTPDQLDEWRWDAFYAETCPGEPEPCQEDLDDDDD